ncbi:MAG: alpha/beta hydrolase [Clostridiales bacterium]|nr:alpha/beta hydrolase [Candidatus Crickella caballi]
MRYVTFGNGDKTMVVVPGLTVGYVTDNASALQDAFSSFAEDYTVYIFDIRDDVPDGYDIVRMSEDLAETMTEMGLRDVYMYGCSMGGIESMYISGKHPELVSKVVIASSAGRSNDNSNRVFNRWIELAKANDKHELGKNMGEYIYSEAFYEANMEVLIASVACQSDESISRFVNTAGVLVNFDVSEEAAAIRCPILVLGSKGDRVMTGQAAEEIARITGGEMLMYGPEYPHAVYDEAPDLISHVKAFFDK